MKSGLERGKGLGFQFEGDERGGTELTLFEVWDKTEMMVPPERRPFNLLKVLSLAAQRLRTEVALGRIYNFGHCGRRAKAKRFVSLPVLVYQDMISVRVC